MELEEWYAAQRRRQVTLAHDREEGQAALVRLLEIARRDSGQPRIVAKFLLGLYNGGRFPFDLVTLRCLDRDIFNDCLAVLRMDYRPLQDVHLYVENGGFVFEQMAQEWSSSSADWSHLEPTSK